MLRTSLAAIALLAAVPVVANPALGGGKGSDVTTPINDTREDILAAAGDAEGVAARAMTIIELDNMDRPIFALSPVSSIPPAPVTAPTGLTTAPSVFNDVDGAPFPFFLLGGLLGMPLLLGSGGDGGGAALPGNPIGTPGGPVEGPPPTEVPVIPEPTTWLMLLLGFCAMGLAVRRSRSRAAAAEESGNALLPSAIGR